jgi:hypothetical protein
MVWGDGLMFCCEVVHNEGLIQKSVHNLKPFSDGQTIGVQSYIPSIGTVGE